MARRRVPRYRKASDAQAQAGAEARRLAEQRRAEGEGRRIRADLSQQRPNNSYGPQRDWYEDAEFTCRDCGRVEVWTAKDQRWYFEVVKAPIYAEAVRCRACRRARKAGGRPPAPPEPDCGGVEPGEAPPEA
jgi:hypothetical protein